ARDVHGRATLIQRAGEFPARLEHEYRISADAARYYKSGKSFAYRHLPFWLASLVDRAAVVLVPIINRADTRPAAGADDLRLAHQDSHLPPLWRTDGTRARRPVAARPAGAGR